MSSARFYPLSVRYTGDPVTTHSGWHRWPILVPVTETHSYRPHVWHTHGQTHAVDRVWVKWAVVMMMVAESIRTDLRFPSHPPQQCTWTISRLSTLLTWDQVYRQTKSLLHDSYRSVWWVKLTPHHRKKKDVSCAWILVYFMLYVVHYLLVHFTAFHWYRILALRLSRCLIFTFTVTVAKRIHKSEEFIIVFTVLTIIQFDF